VKLGSQYYFRAMWDKHGLRPLLHYKNNFRLPTLRRNQRVNVLASSAEFREN
jgi:hypothetical protein